VATAAKWCPHLVEERIPYVTLEDRVILSIALKDKSLSNYPSTLTFILFPKKKICPIGLVVMWHIFPFYQTWLSFGSTWIPSQIF
jgi:hypothetical protein